MPALQRDMGDAHVTATDNGHVNGHATNGTLSSSETTNGVHKVDDDLDVVIVGAGFAGCYLLYKLRKAGFKTKMVEAGSDLGGVWYWNSYPGARVDSQYPIYAYSLPEVYEDWTWTSHYPDHVELRQYFAHVDKKLHIKKDTVFNAKVVSADFDEATNKWTLTCDTGQKFRATHFIASLGFAAKRYFPDWEGLDSFEGVIHHSSFWPHEGVDVRGKRCAVIGTGATGVQITQEWAREIGDDGDLKMFQRTPNLACPMRQVYLTPEQQEKDKKNYPELFNERWNNYNGFLYQYRAEMMFDYTPEERKEFFEMLWNMGGFRFLMNNYYDMTRELKANREAYNFWRDKVRERVKDPVKAELLAPWDPPHPFGAKRLSLEQDFYDHFNRPNVHVVDMKSNPIVRFEPGGIRQQDGTFHELDIIALATGFDSITGGLKDIAIRGVGGSLLSDKWKTGTWAYLGLTTSGFPNFWFTYGPHAPTAFSNGPSCVEIQGDWLVELFSLMRETGQSRADARPDAEDEWRALVKELSLKGVRGHTDSWYNGANIPGKPKEPLNYAGGIPQYIKTLAEVKGQGYKGFEIQ
ncbi:uncharacterized protein A1O5_00176 [Cladophialophora psammophila CBS 110553]|uniref:FAD/NAD(P)-binding domain-containing protein n=1 Tax=Cladophialophora psammophila CBS 110553 TaxID=1182543 RepID=W9XZG9_9EURO|nr:uncharacterized protein A1O5_00176 [Cladophialophora psammophila CBS 110553]EXJ75669.1 hypothetical protein A1O5_00176 [Cladophialophora psammophila CBS 110553]